MTAVAGKLPETVRAASIVDPETFREGVPHDAFRALRARGPVCWVDEEPVDHLPAGPGFWAVVGHAEVAHVLRTPAVFSSALGLTQLYDAPGPLLPALRTMMINMDPPDHSRLRALMRRSFTPAAIRLLEEGIEHRSASLVAAVTGEPGSWGRCDFTRDVVAELPLATLADVLGMPKSDRWLMFDWANRVIGMLDDEYTGSHTVDLASVSPMARRALAARPHPGPDGRMPDSRHPSGMADLYVYAQELAQHLRKEPGPDIMSQLLATVDEDGGQVSSDEFEKLFWLFCVAGNETMRNAIPGGMQALLENPAQAALLWEEPQRLDEAVEEMLRWWSPVAHFRRTATEDVDFGGQRVRAGDKVLVFFSSANRDERVFEAADTFDITRHPNPHIAFGQGPHYCIGAHLARVQMKALFGEILRRWQAVEPDGPPERLRASFQNGIKHQPIRFQAR